MKIVEGYIYGKHPGATVKIGRIIEVTKRMVRVTMDKSIFTIPMTMIGEVGEKTPYVYCNRETALLEAMKEEFVN